MDLIMSMIAGISASQIFVSTPIQSIVAILGLTTAPVIVQVCALAFFGSIAIAISAGVSYMFIKGVINFQQNEDDLDEEELAPKEKSKQPSKISKKSKKSESIEDRQYNAEKKLLEYTFEVQDELNRIQKEPKIDKSYFDYCKDLHTKIVLVNIFMMRFKSPQGRETFESLQQQTKMLEIEMKNFAKKVVAAKAESAIQKKARLEQEIVKLKEQRLTYQINLNLYPQGSEERDEIQILIKQLNVNYVHLSKQRNQIVDTKAFLANQNNLPEEPPVRVYEKAGSKHHGWQIVELQDAVTDDEYPSDDEELSYRLRKLN